LHEELGFWKLVRTYLFRTLATQHGNEYKTVHKGWWCLVMGLKIFILDYRDAKKYRTVHRE
jgi:hypothetical protein